MSCVVRFNIFTHWQILREMLMEKLKKKGKRQTYDMSLWKL